MRRALVALPAMVALLAACSEGRGGDPAVHRRAGQAAAVLCTATQTAGATRPGAAAATDAGSDVADAAVDAAPTTDAGSGSDAAVDAAPITDAGSGSDAALPDAALPDAGTGSGSDGGLPDGGTGGDGGLDCIGLYIAPSMIPLVPLGTGTAEVRSINMFTDQLIAASISGAGFEFVPTGGCGPQSCSFTASPKPLPFTLGIKCTATDGQTHMGTLQAQGAQGPSDVATAQLYCAPSASTALISVTPPSIDAGDVPVGTASSQMFTVHNTGMAALTFSITLPSLVPAWTAPLSTCIAPAQCMVAAGGAMPVPLQFLPTTDGTSSAAILITSNASNIPSGSLSVPVTGRGAGSRITVAVPTSGVVDFGTIPRNSTTSQMFPASAIGNLTVRLDASDPGAPFSVAPPQLSLTQGLPGLLTVSCGSPTATTGPITKLLAFSSPNAYAVDPTSVMLRCAIANTQVSVVPSQFDFGEVRKGSPAPSLPFTISNPGGSDAKISAVVLDGAPGSLSLTVDDDLPHTLPAQGPPLTGQLSLKTDQDQDLAQLAPKLKITVDTEQLVYPVTGKVTTPAAYVTPEKLELGTACVGSSLSAVISMINSGTASLTMEPPRADPGFKLQLQSPPSYPAPLLAGATATLAVSPDVEAPGELAGTLTWAVDAPRSPFVIPVSLAFIDTGTALSPASLTFSTVKVGEISLRYTVTLQNCSTAPVMVTVDGVTATRGSAGAWKVEPGQDARTLAPQDKLTISVAFAPLRQGHHVAQLRLGVDGEDRVVTLEGDGIDLDGKRTSFYACGCNTPRSRSGWPIALAVALIALRRRRRRPRRT